MTYKQAIQEAIRTKNKKRLFLIMTRLRYRYGMNHANLCEFLGRCTGLDKPEIDQIARDYCDD